MNWSLGRPWALGVSWSELEPQEALGGLGPWERTGASGGLGRPRALGASWSEVQGVSHLVKLSLPDISLTLSLLLILWYFNLVLFCMDGGLI